MMKKQLEIPKTVTEQVNYYLNGMLPEEGCGFLIGNGDEGRVTEFHAVENELHSPIAFRMNPSEQIKIMIEAEERHLDILAIVHSHPSGPEHPSKTDMRESRWSEVCNIIVSFKNQPEPIWTGWLLSPIKYEEIPLFIKKLDDSG